MVDLATRYLGLELPHPLVASASPLAKDIGGVLRLEDAGAAAVVLPSIYQEELAAEDRAQSLLVEQGAWAHGEVTTYFPAGLAPVAGLEAHLELVSRASAACDIPIIASLNGSSPTGWVDIARDVVSAGAAAVELNLYRVPTSWRESGQEVEQRWLDTLTAVRAAVSVPISVKLGPWLSSPGHFVQRLVAAGADGLVLFNRFYQPDIDLDTLKPTPALQLSSPYEMRHALLWISLLSGELDASLAASTGVETHHEVVKYLLAGASVVMTTSALLRHGPDHLATLREGLTQWLDNRGFPSVEALRGRLASLSPAAREPLLRAQYAQTLLTYPLSP